MSMRFLLSVDASGGSMRKVADPLAASIGLISRRLCRNGSAGS